MEDVAAARARRTTSVAEAVEAAAADGAAGIDASSLLEKPRRAQPFWRSDESSLRGGAEPAVTWPLRKLAADPS